MLFPLPLTPCYQSHHQYFQIRLELSRAQVVAHDRVHWPCWQNKFSPLVAGGFSHKLSTLSAHLARFEELKKEQQHQGLLG